MAYDFEDTIKKHFGKNPVPVVKGNYPFIDSKDVQSFSVSKDDIDTFISLYKVRSDTNVGNGEVALFWLFGKDNNVSSTAGGAAADLKINNSNVEVKAYDSPIVKIGRFQRQKEFLQLVNTIFSVYNLVNEKNIVFDILNFNYDRLVDAAEEFCIVRQSLNEIVLRLDSNEKNTFTNIKIFKGIFNKAEAFDNLAKKLDLEDICFLPGQKRPGGEMIATQLLKFITERTLIEKPGGRNGFMALLPSNFTRSSSLEFLKVINNGQLNLDQRKINLIPETVNFSSGAMFINFKKLFS